MKSRFFVFLLLMGWSAFAQIDASWELKKNKKEIKIYVKQVPESDVNSFRALANYKISPEKLVQIITDLENYPKWIDNVKPGELIESLSEDEFVFRQVIILPFPFSDREVVQRTIINRFEDGSIKVAITEANVLSPPLEDCVRMKISHGYWLLKPTEYGTSLTYEFLADPGENIPAWLINSLLIDNPFNSLLNLREFIKQE